MVESLLPTVLTKLWSDFTSESHSPPGLADLLKFLTRRSEAVEAIVPPKTSSQSQVPTRAIPTSRSSLYPKALHTREHNQECCRCCSSIHSIYHCSQFKSLNVNKRYNIVRRNHLCFNCLSKPHTIEDCSSKVTCKECGRKYHSLLHKLLVSRHAQSVTANSSTPAPSLASSAHTSLYQQRNTVTSSFTYMPATALAA